MTISKDNFQQVSHVANHFPFPTALFFSIVFNIPCFFFFLFSSSLPDHLYQISQVSFVNSIATTKGGTHVNYIADQVVSALDKIVQRKNKGAPIKAPQIKQHMWLFINCLVENPSFDSQTKENLTRKAKDFGSTCELSAKFLKDVSKSGIVDMILDFARHKSDILMLKSHKGTKRAKLKGIPKLEDANDAGTRNAHTCTLILTEGDSAKALAISGLSVVGRDRYGVFPLRGKLLNVREASHHQIMENAEIKAITQIMVSVSASLYGYHNQIFLRVLS